MTTWLFALIFAGVAVASNRKNAKLEKVPFSPPARSALSILLLLGLAFIVYANSLGGQFVFDDRQVVMQNPQLMNVRSFGDALSLDVEWRRLTFITYGLNYYWGQMDPFGYHLVNMAVHALNSILVLFIILQVTGRRLYPAFAGAAVFSVHPLFTEGVSYIAGRFSSLCAFFYFLGIFFFLKALGSARLPLRVAWLALTALAGVLGWESKQEALTLPVTLAAVFWVRSEKRDWRYLVALAVIPLLVVLYFRSMLASLFASVTNNVVLVSAGFEPVLPLGAYVRTYLTAIVGYYFPRFVFPAHLSADPYVQSVEHWYSPEFLFALAVLGGLGWLLLRPKGRDSLLVTGLATVLVSPLTAYTVVPLADVVLEHRAYIPGLGVAMLWAWLFEWLSKKYGKAGIVAPLLVVVVFGIMTVQRNAAWQNGITLWEDAEKKSPQKPRTHLNLGETYQLAGRVAEAINEYEHALKLKPDIHAAYANIGVIHLNQGRLDQAEEILQKVTTVAPTLAEAWVNLGALYIRKNQPDKALEVLDRALELNPQSSSAYLQKGDALTLRGQFESAVESYNQAIYLRPDAPHIRLNLAMSRYRAGKREAAEKELQGLVGTAVGAEAYRDLGIMSNETGDYDAALGYFQNSARLRPNSEILNAVGSVYLRKQMPDPAIEEFRKALTYQPNFAPAILNLALAYETKGQIQTARQILQDFIQRYGSTGSPYVAQAQERLNALK